MFKGHPKGLFVLALANMGERFGYYTMLAIFVLFMQAKFGFSADTTSTIFGIFLAAVYFLPLFGGLLADKVLGYGKTITLGIVVMFIGYFLLAIPTGTGTGAIVMMFGALLLIAMGTAASKATCRHWWVTSTTIRSTVPSATSRSASSTCASTSALSSPRRRPKAFRIISSAKTGYL